MQVGETHAALCRDELNLHVMWDRFLIHLHDKECFYVYDLFVAFGAVCFVQALTKIADVILLWPMGHAHAFQMEHFWTIFTQEHIAMLAAQVAKFIAIEAHGVLNVVPTILLGLVGGVYAVECHAIVCSIHFITS